MRTSVRLCSASGLCCSNPEVLVAARQSGGDLFVVAANSSLEPAKATLTLPGLNGRRLHVVSEGRTVQPDRNQIELSFLGMETHILTTSLAGVAKLPTLAEIRAEQARMAAQLRAANPSLCTFRDGATLAAPWVVGGAFRAHALKGWKDKDFTSAGRWIEVRFAEPRQVNMLRAIASPWAEVELQIPDAGQWRAVPSETIADDPMRHHSHRSATTTARLAPLTLDRFRVVFPVRRSRPEVVFELSAALAQESVRR